MAAALVVRSRPKRKRWRTAPATVVVRLPRRGYVIREKHLRRYRTLTRELPAARREPVTFAGLLNMGDEGNEIWVEAGLPEPEKRFTIVHELVHARRQRSDEEIDDDVLEEAVVELETVSRVPLRTLYGMPSGTVLAALHRYLTGGGRFDPETRAGLEAVYRRIHRVLGVRRSPVTRVEREQPRRRTFK